MVSKAKSEANQRYDKKTYDRVLMKVRKGGKEKLKDHCALKEASLNSYLKEAVNEKLERDGADFRIE